ncbi:MAG: 50S ribosomal protein L24 [Rhodothermaceae bacterium]|nr:50S ribosomal protein L24 [Bacteroidota bacterium]MXW82838.1 50S ribosomal protein L24 [Rhodothermaceae bacterium]MDE2671249.1 50S ribosomal protein L24 [Bacteroidota bacterium]MXX58205.1 50S ribosomal protein L24 [Rhodothermaceae bacterium]MXZ05533.1 50S ribosomal protein L24 [Rhodothermaceae bacterium]
MARSQRKTKKPHIKKGDMVMLTKDISASKGSPARGRGYVGKVLRVFPERERVIVEGVNLRIRHTRPNQTYPQGGRVQREMSIHISNVQPVDSNGDPTRIGRKRIEDIDTGQGQWVRYAKTTGEELN